MPNVQRQEMVLPSLGGPDVFRLETSAIGARPEDTVRIKVHAAGVNWADVQQRLGLYPEAPDRPYAPGYEVAGVVVEAPADSSFEPGERIVAMTKFGGYASVVDVDPRVAAHIPPGISDEEAAAIPVVWLTAHEALHHRARIREGESVLVHGGAGGVGLAAIALAKQAGCIVIATAGGPEKQEFLKEQAGADFAIDYKAGDWIQQLLDLHGPVDHVLDPLGGEHLRQSMTVLKTGGRTISYGASETAAKGKRSILQALRTIRKMRFNVIPWLRHNSGLLGLNMLTTMQDDPDRLQRTLVSILDEMVTGELTKPVISKTFPLTDVSDAHRFLQSRASIGKVLLIPAH